MNRQIVYFLIYLLFFKKKKLKSKCNTKKHYSFSLRGFLNISICYMCAFLHAFTIFWVFFYNFNEEGNIYKINTEVGLIRLQ